MTERADGERPSPGVCSEGMLLELAVPTTSDAAVRTRRGCGLLTLDCLLPSSVELPDPSRQHLNPTPGRAVPERMQWISQEPDCMSLHQRDQCTQVSGRHSTWRQSCQLCSIFPTQQPRRGLGNAAIFYDSRRAVKLCMDRESNSTQDIAGCSQRNPWKTVPYTPHPQLDADGAQCVCYQYGSQLILQARFILTPRTSRPR
jgi:hypothetical protein